jgi:homoserine kinase
MVTVRAPATCANLGSGYDVFGLALQRPADVVTATRAAETTIEVTGAGAEFIPTDPAENTAGVVARELDAPAHITIDKGVRPASGLGSSAASAAGTAVALDAVYGLGLERERLVRAAATGEAAVAGTPHADNVAPSICGGFTAVTDDWLVATERPCGLTVVAALPDQVVSTAEARKVVPGSVSLDRMTETVGAAATLVAGMYESDPTLLGRGLADGPATEARGRLVNGYPAAAAAARDAGATGVTISGSGPALLAIPKPGTERAVAVAMVDAFEAEGVDARAIRTQIGYGARVLD